MRKPSSLATWLSKTELKRWVRKAPNKAAYQRRLAIWLTYIGPYNAEHVAELIGASKQGVWKSVGQYNRLGPSGLERVGRGGRRRALMSVEEERELLNDILSPIAGRPKTPKQLRSALSEKLQRELSISYVYKLLNRHSWLSLTRKSLD